MAWVNIAKPAETSVLSFSGGVPIGLLIALTTTTISSSIISGWSSISKPTTSSWTAVTKPSSSNWTNVTKPTS